jgi:hypothetical protein
MSVLFGRANPKTVTERALGAGGALHACQLTVTESPLRRVCDDPRELSSPFVWSSAAPDGGNPGPRRQKRISSHESIVLDPST